MKTRFFVFLITLFMVIGVSDIMADSVRIEFPDGPKDCTFQALNFSPSNGTLTVSGCYLGGGSVNPSQPPSPPPVSGDPGAGVWVTPTGVTVFDFSTSSNRTFVPGCINGQAWNQTDCEYQGGMIEGKAYAARVKVPQGGKLLAKFDRAEAGEADGGSGVRGGLSSIPGDMQATNPACVFEAISPYIEIADTIRAEQDAVFDICSTLPPELRGQCHPIEPPCVVAADQMYYLNFTPTLEGCGNGATCRTLLIQQ